jgi:protein phosphatase
MESGDALLLCTDGLTKHVTDAELREALLAAPAAEDACGTLLAAALERGGTDNVTVIVSRFR